MEFEQSILEDLKLLGIKGDEITHTSDHFPRLIDLATQLLKDGNGYIDDTPQERVPNKAWFESVRNLSRI